MARLGKAVLICLSTGSLFAACAESTNPNAQLKSQAVPATIHESVNSSTSGTEDEEALPASFVVLWMDQLRLLVQRGGTNPPAAARIYAYAGLALNESVSMTKAAEPAILAQQPSYPPFPKPEFLRSTIPASATHKKLVLHATLYTLVPALMPNLLASQRQVLQQLDDRVRREIPASPETIAVSRELGQKLGLHLAAWAATDGYAQTRHLKYTVPDREQNPSYWEPTEAFTKPLEPFWSQLRPLAMSTADVCRIPPSVPFSSEADSEFGRQAREVLVTSQKLSPEQAAIARWWSDDPGKTSTPPGHWIALAGQLATEQSLDAAATSRLYALLGMALSDAFISCWDSKFKVNLLRPKTYIRQVLSVPDWSPLIATPPFPEYPSGHSVASGAAAEVLAALLGEQAFVDHTHQEIGLTARHYKSFRTAADEAAISRLYGGIHFRDAIESGLRQGRCIGKQVLSRFKPAT